MTSDDENLTEAPARFYDHHPGLSIPSPSVAAMGNRVRVRRALILAFALDFGSSGNEMWNRDLDNTVAR
jgi:hypothetical protein